jgi:hypothetical protein
MHTLNDEKEKFGHIVLRKPSEKVAAFDMRNMVYGFYEFARDKHVGLYHGAFELDPFAQDRSVWFFGVCMWTTFWYKGIDLFDLVEYLDTRIQETSVS